MFPLISEALPQKLQVIIIAENCSGYVRQKLSNREDDVQQVGREFVNNLDSLATMGARADDYQRDENVTNFQINSIVNQAMEVLLD